MTIALCSLLCRLEPYKTLQAQVKAQTIEHPPLRKDSRVLNFDFDEYC